MIGRMFGRNGSGARVSGSKKGTDVPIVHQTVPDEVLGIPPRDAPPTDMSWMDSIPTPKHTSKSVPTDAKVVREPLEKVAEEVTQKLAAENDADFEVLSDIAANPASVARVKYPHGWLVVVEGPGVGEWFVLERGVSYIGSADGQTVCLNFGDTSVSPVRHVVLSYNEERHTFEMHDSGQSRVRLNGTTPKLPVKLRDGDVISVGETSLRLVGLCTPNFNWS